MLKNRNIPFGYCMVNGQYAINENEAEVVKKIFADYIGGKSLKAIAVEMQIPYNSGKSVWNKNMVCRVLENTKYLGENGFPKIISKEVFKRASRIKSERNTYRKPTPQAKPQEPILTSIEYEPTEEIQRLTNEINLLLDSETSDKNTIEEHIIKCAQLKYKAINEVRK